MNEDTKKKLKEKLGALVTDEQLDKIAGGTNRENLDLLGVLAKVDPEAVKDTFETALWYNREEVMQDLFNAAVPRILKENFGNSITIENSIDGKNKYTYNGKPVSHEQLVEIIAAQGWEVIGEEDL